MQTVMLACFVRCYDFSLLYVPTTMSPTRLNQGIVLACSELQKFAAEALEIYVLRLFCSTLFFSIAATFVLKCLFVSAFLAFQLYYLYCYFVFNAVLLLLSRIIHFSYSVIISKSLLHFLQKYLLSLLIFVNYCKVLLLL